ncbi:NAD(P)-dependent oxidoreductase [Rhizobium sp. RCC_161_2]|uniref:NAD(P)-dependent oxidoreductase n=1 Tax=Rhizobium sp. RCC_161_2 TaxID=3239219 RepID=UPI0035241EE6
MTAHDEHLLRGRGESRADPTEKKMHRCNMKVALFGATGKTGKFMIDEALARGFEATVFARRSRSFADKRVRVVHGDLSNVDLLRDAVRGSTAVLSALGPTTLPHPKDLPITRATQAIISAMKDEDVNRLVAISTGTAPDPGDAFDWKIDLPAMLIKYLMRSTYDDIVNLAQAIRASELEWTMVRVAFLNSRAAASELNVGLYGYTRHSLTVSRKDVAAFMFDQIESRAYTRQAPGISTR